MDQSEINRDNKINETKFLKWITLILIAILLLSYPLNTKTVEDSNTVEKESPTIEYANPFVFQDGKDIRWQSVENNVCLNKLDLKIEAVKVIPEIKKNTIEYTLSDKKDIVDFIISFDWDDTVAVQTFVGESGLNEKVISMTNDVGVAQINLKAHYKNIPGDAREEKIEWLQDYKNNVSFAYSVYKDAGYSFIPWVYYNNNLYNFIN